MHNRFALYKAIDFRDADIDYVRSERKFWAQRDQDSTLDKKERKEAQRWVKVCSIVLECMTGMVGGKWEGQSLDRWPAFPDELQEKIFYLFTQATGDRKAYKDLLDAADEYVKTAMPNPRYMRDWLLPDSYDSIGHFLTSNAT